MNNDIKIKFSSNIKAFADSVEQTTKSLESMKTTVTGMSENTVSKTFRTITQEGNNVIKMSQRFNKVTGEMTGWSASIKEVGTESKNVFQTLGELNTRLLAVGATAVKSIKMAYTNMKKFTSYSIDQSEALNLFNVVFNNIEENGTTTFSKLGKKADEFQQKLKTNFGANLEESYTYQALYQSMAQSQGINDEVAAILSENTTEMVYDLSSLFNKNQDDTAEALRAGIYAGQTKPLRNYGIDITETSLQATLDEMAVTNEKLKDMSVSTMSQAEKQILRYITVVKQASVAQGDYANTLESPANQLKILENQLAMTGAAIGNLLVKPFQKLLQITNAVIIVIRLLAESLADFFGITQEDYNSGAIASYSDDVDDYADNLSNASDEADKLKRKTLGFDQINNIDTSKDTSSSSGSGISQDLIDGISDWTSGLDDVKLKAQDIAESIMDWLGFTYDEIDEVWKLKDGFQNIYWVAGLVGTVLGSIVLGSISSVIAKVIGLSEGTKKLKDIITKAKLLKFITKIGALTLAIAGVVTIITNVNKLLKGDTESALYGIVGGIGLITTGILLLVNPIGAVAAAAVTAIALTMSWLTKDQTGILTTEEAYERLEKAIENVTEAQLSYTNAVDSAENAQKKLQEAEEATGLSGEALYQSVQNGTLDYANMTAQQREVYKAYLDNQSAEEELREKTEALNEAKKNQTQAELENALAIAKESGDYDTFKQSVVDAFEQGKISADEAQDYIERACGGMSDDFKSTFTEDLPEDISDGLDTDQYDTKWTKFKRWFGNKIDEIGEKVDDLMTKTIPNKISGAWSKIAEAAKSLWRKAWNLLSDYLAIKSTIQVNDTLRKVLSAVGVDVASSYTLISLPKYADGGFPEEGPFMMNRGEMAGKFSNGKSVVANNEQITEGIKRAVLSGMNEALASNEANVKLDIRADEGIIVKKAINGINQITRTTGESPLAW